MNLKIQLLRRILKGVVLFGEREHIGEEEVGTLWYLHLEKTCPVKHLEDVDSSSTVLDCVLL